MPPAVVGSAFASLLVVGLAASASAQGTEAGGPARDRVIGTVQGVDAAQRTLTLLGDDGSTRRVILDLETSCLRAQPGALDLKTAVAIDCSQLAVKDRILARGRLTASSFQARQVVAMSRADIEQKQTQDRAEWRRRGAAGVVKALDPTNGSLTVEVRSFFRSREFQLSTTERKAAFRRYPPDVTRFSGTEPSSFDAIKVGDQIQALGDWTEDRARFLAEEVVSGSFRTVVGSVERLGPDVDALILKVLPNKAAERKGDERLTIHVEPEASVRRLPTEMLARFVGRRAGANAGLPAGAGSDRNGLARGARGGDAPGAGARSVGDMWERLPTIKLTEVQTGEYVAVAVAESRTVGQARATAVLAGIEPLIRESQPAPGEEGPTFSIEGLDLGMGQP